MMPDDSGTRTADAWDTTKDSRSNDVGAVFIETQTRDRASTWDCNYGGGAFYESGSSSRGDSSP